MEKINLKKIIFFFLIIVLVFPRVGGGENQSIITPEEALQEIFQKGNRA